MAVRTSTVRQDAAFSLYNGERPAQSPAPGARVVSENETVIMTTLAINLLGEFRVTADGVVLSTLNTGRLQILLAYLVLNRRAAISRQHLAFLLWPDSTDAQARTNLRNLLHSLNKALPDAEHYLSVNGSTLQWRSDAPYSLEVEQFEQAIANPNSTQALRAALESYRGELLPGVYEEWLLAERERLGREFIRTLERVVDQLQSEQQYAQAIEYAKQLVRQDPLREDTYRRLMHLYALTGDRTGVKRIYDQCAGVLKRELDVEPSRETRQAYQQALRLEPSPLKLVASPTIAVPFTPPQVLTESSISSLPVRARIYRWRGPVQNVLYGVTLLVPLALLAILVLVVQLPLLLGLVIAILVFAGLFLLLNWRTRVEQDRQNIRDDIRRKLDESGTRVSQIRALAPRIQNVVVQARVLEICKQADALLARLSVENTTLATSTRLEFVLAEMLDILVQYIQIKQGRVGGQPAALEATVTRIEQDLIPQLQTALQDFGASLDQGGMIKLEAAIRVLESTLKSEGLG